MTSTIERQIKCVARELAMRKSVYPKFISSKRMKPHQAEEEISVMEDVLKTLYAAQEIIRRYERQSKLMAEDVEKHGVYIEGLFEGLGQASDLILQVGKETEK